jgi:hypothetical protein
MEKDDVKLLKETLTRCNKIIKEAEELSSWLGEQKITAKYHTHVFFIPYHIRWFVEKMGRVSRDIKEALENDSS